MSQKTCLNGLEGFITMNGLNLYLADGTLGGPVIMTSASSFFNAVRVKRADVLVYANDLSYPGVYMLLIGNDTVYVGQSGLSTVYKRIQSPHSGNIDSLWHTVAGFCCKNQNISNNELLFIENAMCEFAHKNYAHCVTTSPSKATCNATFRNQHYNLNGGQINACNQYIKDIKHYIACLGDSFFGTGFSSLTNSSGTKELFYFKNPSKGVDGKADILIHTGNTAARTAVLKAGSILSANVSDHFSGSISVKNKRLQLQASGAIVGNVLQTDITFTSQSSAGAFLNGTSFDGNKNWKTVNGDIPLKQLLI